MVKKLFFGLLGALMVAAWAGRPTAAAYLATSLLVLMVAATFRPSTHNRPPSDRI